MKAELTQESLHALLSYDPETGVFHWRSGGKGRHTDLIAGWIKPGRRRTDYRCITIAARNYQVHRLAWLYVHGEWPAAQIDHVNGNGLDNRLCNLRPATQSQNTANSRTRLTNTSGYKGVNWHKRSKRWAAQIMVNGRQLWLGYFDTAETAGAAYAAAAKASFGEYARALASTGEGR